MRGYSLKRCRVGCTGERLWSESVGKGEEVQKKEARKGHKEKRRGLWSQPDGGIG